MVPSIFLIGPRIANNSAQEAAECHEQRVVHREPMRLICARNPTSPDSSGSVRATGQRVTKARTC
jgi:hypothetical protein